MKHIMKHKMNIAIFISVILLSFGVLFSTKAEAASYFFWVEEGNWSFDGEEEIELTSNDAKVRVQKDNNSDKCRIGLNIEDDSLKDGVGYYRITVTNDDGEELRYGVFLYENNYPLSIGLKKIQGTNRYVLAQNYTDTSTTLETFIYDGTNYLIGIYADDLDKIRSNHGINISIKKISATVALKSDKDKGIDIPDNAVYEGLIGSTIISSRNALTYNYTVDYQRVLNGELTDEERDALIKDLDKTGEAEKSEKGSFIEGILANILIAFGELVQWLIEVSFGFTNEESFSLDALIFNRVPKVAIDTRKIFKKGIQIGPAQKIGYLADDGVANVIQQVFSGLRQIAIVVYIIILLYVAIRILMGVGTPDEAKVKKYFQYWVTGLLLLFIVPYFLNVIPSLNNALVEVVSTSAKSTSSYTVSDIAKELGKDYFGEDAEIPQMKSDLKERIRVLQDRVSDGYKEGDYEKAQEQLEAYLRTYIDNARDIDEEDKGPLRQSIMHIKEDFIDRFYLVWNSVADAKLEEAVLLAAEDRYSKKDFTMAINEYTNSLCMLLFGDPSRPWMRNCPLENASQSEKDSIRENIRTTYRVITENPDNDVYLTRIEIAIDSCTGVTEENKTAAKNQCKNTMNAMRRYMQTIKSNYAKNIKNVLLKYKDALTGYKLDMYEEMLAGLRDDPMSTLVQLAKEQQRIVYAIAWFILLFQTFMIMFMYLKRLIVTILLICLFPIVMAMYVIDKMGDGKAQSLETWFKEYLANTTVQFFHALVYVLVVNMGIDACRADPTRNWFVLLIAVCSLFPVERILRDIMGMQSSTLGTLRFSGAAAIGLGVAALKGGRNLLKGAKSGASFAKASYGGQRALGAGRGAALAGVAKDAFKQGKNNLVRNTKKAWEKAGESKGAAKKKRRSDLQAARARNRAALQARAANGGGAILKARAGLSRITGFASNVNGRFKGSIAKVKGGVVNAMNKTAVGRATVKGFKVASKMGKLGAQTARFVAKPMAAVYKRSMGFAMGATSLTESMASGGGLAQGFTAARSTANSIIGAKDKKKQQPQKAPVNSSKSPYNANFGAVGEGPLSTDAVAGALGDAVATGVSAGVLYSALDPSSGVQDTEGTDEQNAMHDQQAMQAEQEQQEQQAAEQQAIDERAANQINVESSQTIEDTGDAIRIISEGTTQLDQVTGPIDEVNNDSQATVTLNEEGSVETVTGSTSVDTFTDNSTAPTNVQSETQVEGGNSDGTDVSTDKKDV